MTFNYLKTKYNLVIDKPIIEIPGVSRLDLIRWIRELDFKVGAEIGVYVGDFSRLITTLNPQFKLYGIDPWKDMSEYRELGGERFEDLYQETVRKLRPQIRKGRFEIVRKTSMEALKDFEDESLDFVYIDGNHEAPFVQQDIEGWAKKVRKGGIVSGHDYIRVRAYGISLHYDIIRAVNEYCKKNNHILFILGKKAKETGVVRERIRSWAFVR